MPVKSVFYSRLVLPVSSGCCSGSKLVDTFEDSFDSKGVSVVTKSGSSNLFEFIQGFKADTDIYSILNRLILSGGELPQVDTKSYVDISELPSNVHEAFASVRNAQKVFNGLDSSVRNSYHNSFTEFMADFGSEKFFSIFSNSLVSDSVSVSKADSGSEVNSDVE